MYLSESPEEAELEKRTTLCTNVRTIHAWDRPTADLMHSQKFVYKVYNKPTKHNKNKKVNVYLICFIFTKIIN